MDDHTMVLPNWNTTVCVKGMIPENTTHIGIRAHYLRLPENGQRENLVECQNGKILDDPFELVVVFEHDVWWKIPKESWQKEYQEKCRSTSSFRRRVFFICTDKTCKL